MKKIYLAIPALLMAVFGQAQVVDFESFSLSGSESYDNGETNGGDFVVDGLTFTNVYTVDPGGDYWSGFAISNVTDNINPGPANQYGNYFGAGNGSSSNFAVYNWSGQISTNSVDVSINQFMITNTTYAAISMRDGDAFGKEFGSIYAADGVTVDGTNGEDFFRLWIIGESFDGTQTDSIEFYLADYRFADDNDDYIVDEWEAVDLSSFSFDVATVNFRFESSDVGQWGMNTPAYFAIDDIGYTTSGVGLEEASQLNVRAYPNPVENTLSVKGEVGILTLRSVSGHIIYSANHANETIIDVSELASGIYFLSLDNDTGHFMERIVK